MNRSKKNDYGQFEREEIFCNSSFDAHFVNDTNKQDLWKADKSAIKRKKREAERYFKDINFYPKVSIIIPVYNGANYVRDAIESALAQTYGNVEIIVVNDGSKDNGETERIALSYGDRIRYFFKENGGVASALNLGIEKMVGEYFSWLSHDDIYMPEKVALEVEKASKCKNPDAIIFSSYITINEKGEKLREYHLPKNVTENIECLLALDITYTLNGCTLLIPRQVFRKYGVFNVERKYTQDYELWFHLCKFTEYVYIDECLLLSRQHQGQGGKKNPYQVTLESDDFHHRAIVDLSVERVYNYACGKIEEIIHIFTVFKDSSYILSSIAIIKLIYQFYNHIEKEEEGYKYLCQVININVDKCKRFSNDENNILIQRPDNPILMIYSNAWTFGGIERVVAILIDYFKDKYSIVLVTEDNLTEKGYNLPNTVTHIVLRNECKGILSFRIAALANVLGTALFIGNPNIIKEFIPVYKILHDINIRTIASNHYYYFLPYQVDWLRPIASERFDALRWADAVTWPTSFSGYVCSQIINNVAVMPNPNTYDGPTQVNDKRSKVVLAVGRFYDTIKRVDMILYSFKEIYRLDPEAKLILVGGYNMNMVIPDSENLTLQALLSAMDLPNEAITFVGEQTDVKKYYEQSSVLILTSECEGFPMVLNEAGVCGVPVVVFEIPGLDEIIIDAENGYIVPQCNYKEMAEKVVFLLNNHEHWKYMSKRATELAERFKKEVICTRWEKLVEIVLQGNNIRDCLVENNLSPNIKSIKEICSKIILEYERCLNVKSMNKVTNNINENTTKKNNFVFRKTRLFRIAKKVYRSLKKYGLVITVKKGLKKIAGKIANVH